MGSLKSVWEYVRAWLSVPKEQPYKSAWDLLDMDGTED